MQFDGFNEKDFSVFAIDGLEARMEKLIERVRPKLEELGKHFAAELSSSTGEEMFYHVAKHARRTVNPPNDTWVAFSSSNRGYKKLPHFQIGLFETHIFIWFAVIYESPVKKEFAALLKKEMDSINKNIPDNFVWSQDHMKPDAFSHLDVKNGKLSDFINSLANVKKAELLCGIHIPKEEAIRMDGDTFIHKADSVFQTLMPLYQLKKKIYSQEG
ncbi:Uncharacterized protein YktB, UPF0637 family [Fictibacillus solisalsi]|uniref:UPF0637 protein SAMN04488137_1066 n=1 Tax=Fictibacillus solisalsi TaxID=459525 RepID=A0A1G9UPX7_9BACL|nr:DUF1054 domain-containing protein [Fictibacillus solisalsi]SDM61969.1 Uncharacterized protein YktB, UPF0637 family [Fictibacillus solisalsi]